MTSSTSFVCFEKRKVALLVKRTLVCEEGERRRKKKKEREKEMRRFSCVGWERIGQWQRGTVRSVCVTKRWVNVATSSGLAQINKFEQASLNRKDEQLLSECATLLNSNSEYARAFVQQLNLNRKKDLSAEILRDSLGAPQQQVRRKKERKKGKEEKRKREKRECVMMLKDMV